jgi:phage/plasmid-like protein (TIGR03299 family)
VAHEIEQFTDGTAAFASARESAWHKLGTITEGAMTAEEAMRLASLANWNVRLLPLTATEITADGTTPVEVAQHFATARTHPKTGRTETLGVVGSDYLPVQNEEHAEFLNLLADESGAHFETAGSLKNGRQVFLTMRMPQSLTIGGHDRVDLYIAAFNSHDGSSAFRIVVTPIRVVCANTQRAAIQGARSSFVVRHTAGAKARIAQARSALGLTFRYAEEFEKAAQRMIEAEMTLAELRSVVDQLWPVKNSDSARAKTNQRQRWAAISNLFEHADTQASVRHTRWAGYNALTEYANHVAPARGKTEADKTAARAERIISGTANDLMEKAFALTTV